MCVVVCDHLYSQVSSMDGLARMEQVVRVEGEQTVCGTDCACVLLYQNPERRNILYHNINNNK